MDESTYAKRRLFRILSWIMVGLYIVLNVGVLSVDTPLSVLVFVLPIINILIIGGWFVLRAFFNISNGKIKHAQYLESRPSETPPSYSHSDPTYIPDVTIPTELFNSMNPGTSVQLDLTLKNYLQPGRTILFHDETNYGTVKRLSVKQATVGEGWIEASFVEPGPASAQP